MTTNIFEEHYICILKKSSDESGRGSQNDSFSQRVVKLITMHIYLLKTLFKVLNQKVVKITYYFQRLKIEGTMNNTYIRKKKFQLLFSTQLYRS